MLAEADHHPDEAESHYRNWYAGSGECGPCGLFELAKLADAAGRTDSALALYDRGIAVPSLTRFRYDAYRLPEALKRAGELYEAKGDRAKAADRYRRFVDLWKDADPELQPGVREVRARIARLATEPGT
jgi:tetratricopeptide (TPR) repeat protein